VLQLLDPSNVKVVPARNTHYLDGGVYLSIGQWIAPSTAMGNKEVLLQPVV
jgi:hypothetical protein